MTVKIGLQRLCTITVKILNLYINFLCEKRIIHDLYF